MRVEFSGKQKCSLRFVWSLAAVFGLMLGIPGCVDNSGDASPFAEAPEQMVWKYAIGDKVLHKSGVLGVVVDMDFYCLDDRRGFGRYAIGENQWKSGKKMQCYYIRISSDGGLTQEWVSVLELEDAPDG